MRLRKFRVRAFRCIHDSGEIKVGDLAAFVGRNESGKTTILQALTLLNKEEKVSELDSENKELKKQLSDLKDILIKVENNTHLLMLGRIKTGAKEAK